VKIAVCVKRVPDMDVRFKIATDGTSVDETGVKFDLNDFDAWAVEAALQLKEKAGTGEVVVLSLGPNTAQETLRKALSMGADRAIHLQSDRIPFDSYAIASALASELKDGGYDLILFGKLAPDSSNGVTGPIVADQAEDLGDRFAQPGVLEARQRAEVGDFVLAQLEQIFAGPGRRPPRAEGLDHFLEVFLAAEAVEREGLRRLDFDVLLGQPILRHRRRQRGVADAGEAGVGLDADGGVGAQRSSQISIEKVNA
jgi:hypothetical protein